MTADPLEHRYRVASGNMELEHRRASLVEPIEENGQMMGARLDKITRLKKLLVQIYRQQAGQEVSYRRTGQAEACSCVGQV